MTDGLDIFQLVSGRNPTIILDSDLTLSEANERRDQAINDPGCDFAPRIRLQKTS